MSIKKLVIVCLIGIAIVGGGFALYRLGDIAPSLKNKKPAMAQLPQTVQLENVDKKVENLQVMARPNSATSNAASQPVLQSNVSSKAQSVTGPIPGTIGTAPGVVSNHRTVTNAVGHLAQPVTSTLQDATNYTEDLLSSPLGL